MRIQNKTIALCSKQQRETVDGARGRTSGAFFLTLVTEAPRLFEISGPFVDSVHSIGHNIYTRKPTPRAMLVIHNRQFCD